MLNAPLVQGHSVCHNYKKLCCLGISYIHSNIVVEIDRAFYLCIKFCPDVADIMQLKDAKQRMYEKLTTWEFLQKNMPGSKVRFLFTLCKK